MNDLYPDYDEPRAARHRTRRGHERVLSDLKAWIDGELPAPRVWFVQAHLLVCSACREEVKWLKRLGEDMRDLERAVPSPRLRARILAALPDAPPGRPAKQAIFHGQWPRYAVAGAMACAGLLFAVVKMYGPVGPRMPSSETVNTGPGRGYGPRVSTYAQNGVSAGTLPVGAPDEHTSAADRMYAQWQHEQEHRASRELSKNQANWKTLVAALHPGAAKAGSGEGLRLALYVPDIAEAEKQLTAWARSIGGSDGPPHASSPIQGVAPVVTGAEAKTSGPAGSEPPTDADVLALRVPASRVASLEPVLRRMGAFDTGTAPAIGVNRIRRSQVSARPREGVNDRAASTRVDGITTAEGELTSVTGARARPSEQVAGRDNDPALITLHIQLTSFEPILP